MRANPYAAQKLRNLNCADLAQNGLSSRNSCAPNWMWNSEPYTQSAEEAGSRSVDSSTDMTLRHARCRPLVVTPVGLPTPISRALTRFFSPRFLHLMRDLKPDPRTLYKRVVLKLSGEVLRGG